MGAPEFIRDHKVLKHTSKATPYDNTTSGASATTVQGALDAAGSGPAPETPVGEQTIIEDDFTRGTIDAQDFDSNIIAAYEFEDNADDLKASFDGTLVGSPSFVLDKNVGKAIALNGTSQYVDCGDDPAFSFGNGTSDVPFSVQAWINTNNPIDPQGQMIVSKHKGQIVGKREWYYWIDATGFLQAVFRDNSNGATIRMRSNSAPFTPNAWHHVAFTYDGSSTAGGITLYLDGVAIPQTAGFSGSYVAMSDTSIPMAIGADFDGSENPRTWFNGEVAQVALFDKELTQEEITTLYSNGAPLPYNSSSKTGFGNDWTVTNNGFIENGAWVVNPSSGNVLLAQAQTGGNAGYNGIRMQAIMQSQLAGSNNCANLRFRMNNNGVSNGGLEFTYEPRPNGDNAIQIREANSIISQTSLSGLISPNTDYYIEMDVDGRNATCYVSTGDYNSNGGTLVASTTTSSLAQSQISEANVLFNSSPEGADTALIKEVRITQLRNFEDTFTRADGPIGSTEDPIAPWQIQTSGDEAIVSNAYRTTTHTRQGVNMGSNFGYDGTRMKVRMKLANTSYWTYQFNMNCPDAVTPYDGVGFQFSPTIANGLRLEEGNGIFRATDVVDAWVTAAEDMFFQFDLVGSTGTLYVTTGDYQHNGGTVIKSLSSSSFTQAATTGTFFCMQLAKVGANTVDVKEISVSKIAVVTAPVPTVQHVRSHIVTSALGDDVFFDLKGLDINADGVYMLSYKVKTNGVGGGGLMIAVNNDTTYTNYEYDYHQADGNLGHIIGEVNQPRAGEIFQSAASQGHVIIKLNQGWVHMHGFGGGRAVNQDVFVAEHQVRKLATVTNITELNIAVNSASGMGAGSEFHLYKIKQ